MKTKTLFYSVIVSAFCLLPSTFGQGVLTPPGAPAAGMKSLAQIEPRTPISAAPFTISAGGSYYLTTNLTVSAGDAITIAAGNVTLDLNGFSSTIAGLNGSGTVDSSGPTAVATLMVSNSTDAAFGGAVQDSGLVLALVKTGTAAQSLNGTNTYIGLTTVSNGTLFVNGVLGTNSVTVAGGTLAGVGNVLGAVTVQSGGLCGLRRLLQKTGGT